jgi:hypothetical protein
MDTILREYKDIEWRTYETFIALVSFKNFWTETERLILEAARKEELLSGPKWIPASHEESAEHSEERRVARYLHDDIVTPIFRYSVVVILFTTFEKELGRFADNLEKETKATISYKDLKGTLQKQITSFSKAFGGPPLDNIAGHNEISDLKTVRNCIVHARGEPSLLNDKDRAYLLNRSSPIR